MFQISDTATFALSSRNRYLATMSAIEQDIAAWFALHGLQLVILPWKTPSGMTSNAAPWNERLHGRSPCVYTGRTLVSKCVSEKDFAGSGPNFALWGWVPLHRMPGKVWILVAGSRYHAGDAPSPASQRHPMLKNAWEVLCIFLSTWAGKALVYADQRTVYYSRLKAGRSIPPRSRSFDTLQPQCTGTEAISCRQIRRRFCRCAKEEKSKAPDSCQYLPQIPSPCRWTKSLPAIGRRISALSHDDGYRKPVQDSEFDVGRFGLAAIRRRVRNSNLTCDWVEIITADALLYTRQIHRSLSY